MSYYSVQQKDHFCDTIRKNSSLLDLYGTPVNLQIEKQKKFVSTIGIISSLIVLIICGLLLGRNLQSVIQKQNPNVISSQTLMTDSPVNIFYFSSLLQSFSLKPNNFTLVGMLVDPSNMSSIGNREAIYKIEYYQCTRLRNVLENGNINISQTCVNLQSEPCDLDKHFPHPAQKQFFEKFRLDNAICINQTNWKKNIVELKGLTNNDRWSYLQMKALACKNTTDFQGCAPQDQIKKTLSAGYFATYLSDYLNDQKDADNPYQLYTKLISTAFSFDYSKTLMVNYGISTTSTDKGLLLEDLDEQTALMYISNSELQNAANPNFLINLMIQLDGKVTTTKRNYQKIQDVFGNIGGLYNVLYYSLFIFIMPIVQLMMNLNIIDKFFTFQVQDEVDEDSDCNL